MFLLLSHDDHLYSLSICVSIKSVRKYRVKSFSKSMMLTIGKLAKHCDMNVETIRYYQRIGLLRVPKSTTAYRYYNEQDIETLSFIQKAKDAGLQLSEIQELLTLELDDRIQVRQVIEQRLEKIDQRIRELQSLKLRLVSWLDECKSSSEDCCPILKALKNSE